MYSMWIVCGISYQRWGILTHGVMLQSTCIQSCGDQCSLLVISYPSVFHSTPSALIHLLIATDKLCVVLPKLWSPMRRNRMNCSAAMLGELQAFYSSVLRVQFVFPVTHLPLLLLWLDIFSFHSSFAYISLVSRSVPQNQRATTCQALLENPRHVLL